MLSWVEHEKSFITSGPDLATLLAQTYLSQYFELLQYMESIYILLYVSINMDGKKKFLHRNN